MKHWLMKFAASHRMPDDMFAFAAQARARGVRVIVAGAGGAAHLPGMLAAKTSVPVLGVPVPTRHLQGVDSLYSIVQMPKGIPVATFAIGAAGAANAALFAAAMLAGDDPALLARLEAYRAAQTEEEVGAHQMKVAKEFILTRIQSQGMLVIDEAPTGQNGLVAMAALSQLVEEGKIRAVQEKRQTVYLMNSP